MCSTSRKTVGQGKDVATARTVGQVKGQEGGDEVAGGAGRRQKQGQEGVKVQVQVQVQVR